MLVIESKAYLSKHFNFGAFRGLARKISLFFVFCLLLLFHRRYPKSEPAVCTFKIKQRLTKVCQKCFEAK